MGENCKACIKKITVRNFITVATIATFLAIVMQIVFVSPEIADNSVLMFILGSFMTAVTMIYTFYYRKNKTKPEWDDPYDDIFKKRFEDEDDRCRCCGRKF